jgi:flavin reductase (DIM6/NTAB) family NADH-FMN oxidoreductase RutF
MATTVSTSTQYIKGHVSTADFRAQDHCPADDFKSIFRNYPGGVALVSADDGTGPVACIATSVVSMSIDPPLLGFSASALSSSTPALLRAETIVVHFLAEPNLDLARLCSTSGSDRFADPESWVRLPTGEPLFPEVRTWVRGEIVSRLTNPGGVWHVVRGLEASVPTASDGDVAPLVYVNRTWHRIGENSRVPAN